MVSDNALVRIRELRYSYPGSDHDVLRIPFFDVTGRGLIAVTGPSGSGKSTLVELIAGTLRGEYRGSVEVLGQEWKNLHRDSDRQRHLRRIGLIPQDYGLLTDRSVVDLLLQDLRDAGSGRTNEAERVRAALREVGLEGFEHRQVAALSGGQRQRVAIARMLARDVELVIADEPTANLDPTLTEETVSLFRRLADHVPVLIITHDSQVAAACDRTVVLQSAVSDVSPQPVATAGRSRRRRGRVLTTCLVVALIAGGIAAYVIAKGTRQNSAAATGGLRSAPHAAATSPSAPATTPSPTTPPTTVPPPSTTETTTLPSPPAVLSCGAGGAVVRPTSLAIGCADEGITIKEISWTVYSINGAGGVGTESVNNCVPDCADGTFTNFPVNVQLSNPGYQNGVYVFQTISTYPLSSVGQPGSSTIPGGSWGAA